MRTSERIVLLACLLLPSLAPAQQADRRDRKDPELVIESGGRMGTCDQMSFTADGRKLVAIGDDKVVRVWSYQDGKIDPDSMKVLRWPTWRQQRGAIYAMALDRAGKRVAIGGIGLRAGNAAVTVLDLATGAVLHSSRPPNPKEQKNFYGVRAIAFSPSEKQAAYGTSDGRIWLWNLKGKTSEIGRHAPARAAQINRIFLVSFLDEERLLTLAEDGSLAEWNLKRDPPERKDRPLLGKPKWAIFRAIVSPDGKWLVAAAWQTVYVRSLDGEHSNDIELPKRHFARSIAFDSRSRLAVGIGRLRLNTDFYIETNDLIRFYDLTSSPARASAGPPHTYRADFLAFHPKRTDCLAVAGGDNHEVTLWDLRDKRKPASVIRGKGTGLWDVALSADDRYLGIRDQRDVNCSHPNRRGRGPWRVFDLVERDWVAADKLKPAPRADAFGWQVVPDRADRLLWYAVDPAGTRHPLPLTRTDEMPRCHAFLPRGEGEPLRLAVGHLYGVSIYVLSPSKGARRVRLCVGHQGEVNALAVSATGQWLVSVSSDQTVAAWNLTARPSNTELGTTFRPRRGRLVAQTVDLFSPAWEAGMVRGDELMVLAVAGRKVFDCDGKKFGPTMGKIADCQSALKDPFPGKELFFAVRREKSIGLVPLLTTLKHRPLWRFFPANDQDKEWVLWMGQHHYYDTSANGDYLVGWHVNNPKDLESKPEFYRAERFRGIFFRRQVFDLLLGTRDVAKTLNAAKIDLVPLDFRKLEPHRGEIKVSTKTVLDKDLEVRVRADPNSDNPDRIPTRLELWINDHRLHVWEPKGYKFAKTVTLPRSKLRTGKNLFTFQCYNEVTGRGEGRSEVSVEVSCPRKGSRPALHGLAVGINDYSKSRGPGGKAWPSLRGAFNDAQAMVKSWKQSTLPLYDPGRSQLELLPGKAGDANPANILASLKDIARRAKPDDVVVLFLGGHGEVVESKGEHFFVFCGAKYDRANFRTTGVTGRALYAALAEISCRKVILLDACQAGGLGTSPVRDLTPGGLGPTILAACGRGERSYESPLGNPKMARGLFSYAITQTLDSPPVGGPNEIGPKELYDNVKQSWLPGLLRDLKQEGAQNPIHFPINLDPQLPGLAKVAKPREKK